MASCPCASRRQIVRDDRLANRGLKLSIDRLALTDFNALYLFFDLIHSRRIDYVAFGW